MAKLDPKKLREEEIFGGFTPQDSDEDSFNLEMFGGKYPGEIPNFSVNDDTDARILEQQMSVKNDASANQSDTAINNTDTVTHDNDSANSFDELEQTEEGFTMAQQIEVPEGANVWDMLEGNESLDNSDRLESPMDTEQDTSKFEKFDLDDRSDLQPLSDPQFFGKEILPEGDKYVMESESIDSEPNIQDDPELMALLQQEINRSLKNKEMREMIQDQDDTERQKIIDQQESDDFFPVDDMPNVEEIDLTAGINASSPSKYKDEENNKEIDSISDKPEVPSAQPAKKDFKKKLKVDKQTKVIEDEETPAKRKFPLMYILIPVAAAIILSGIALLVFYFFFNNPLPNNEDVAKHKNKASKQELTKKNNNIDKSVKESPNSVTQKTEGNSHDSALTLGEMAKNSKASEMPNDAKNDKNLAKDNHENITNDSHTNHKKQKLDNESKRPAQVRSLTDNGKNLNKKHYDTKSVIHGRNSSIANNATEYVNSKAPKYIDNENSLYVVQIYASQSEEDANSVAEKLKKKNINAQINTHKVRDQIWYRVRFGNFKTKDEAQTAALKLGYAQTWIDRVR